MKFSKLKKYSLIVIFDDGTFRSLITELVDISINDEKEKRILTIKMMEYINSFHNFGDVVSVVIDLTSDKGDIVTRKFLDVEFLSYDQVYGSNNSNMELSFSLINLDYKILSIEIYQDDNLPYFESFIRDKKIQKLLS